MIRFPKPLFFSLLTLISCSPFAAAEVDLEQIPGDTNWLVHLDVTSLQDTQLWTQIGKEHFELFIEENGIPLNPDKIIDVVKTITAHGSSLPMDETFDGVVVLRGTTDLTSIVEALILSFVDPAEEGTTESIEPATGNPYILYHIGPEVTIALLSDSRVAVSKSRERIAHCVEVMAGNEPNLATSRNLGSFGSSPGSFFQMGATAGIADRPVPHPVQKVLRLVDGLQLEIGEMEQSMVLAVSAHSNTAEIAQEVAKIAEGTATLAGIVNPENEMLVTLTDSIEVETNGQMVRLTAHYPVDALVEIIQAMQPSPFEPMIGDDAVGGARLEMHLSASSTDSEISPDNTLDGLPETRWSAQGEEPWLRYELAQESTINGVSIAWYKGDTRKRYVEVDLSRDGTEWSTVYEGFSSGDTAELETYDFDPALTRWVQLRFESESAATWHSITEVELAGTDTSITASTSSTSATAAPTNAVDGDLDTRWSESGNAWLLFELETPSVVQEAAIAWYQGDTRNGRFELQVSDDQEIWTTILRHESDGSSLGLERANTIDTPARWVKLIGLGNSDSDWTSITHFELYGVPVDRM